MADLVGLLRECVVKIVDRTGFRGSGFFVAPGLVMSCAHVVEDASGGVRVAWRGGELPVIDVRAFPTQRGMSKHYPLPDLAVLRVDEPVAHGSVWLGDVPPVIGVDLVGVGFSSDSPAGAVATDSILVTTVGPAGEGFVKVKGDRVPAGMSGSPLLDMVTGRVCGMLKASRDYAASEGGWIVPAGVVAEYVPEVVAANAVAHSPGEVWRDLATDRAGWTRRLFGEAETTAVPDPPRDPRPSWWLEPRNQVVEFYPRPELGELRRWCQDGAREHSVRLVRASGGVGKTRLGLQLCRELQREGWIAGVMRSGASLDPLVGEALSGAVGVGHRVLAVIDYAETFAHDLPRVVKSLLRCPAASVRLLLLARNTSRWWENLVTEATCGHLIDPDPVALSNLGGEDLGDRQAVITAAYWEFTCKILPDQSEDDGRLPDGLLAAVEEHPRVLSLHALALNHVLDRQTRRPSTCTNPLQGIVAHERRYWQRLATRTGIVLDPTDRLADHILLVPTLYPARDFADAEATLARIPRLVERFPGHVEELAVSLASIYPNTNPKQDRYWDPMQPDKLGETLLADVLADHPSDERAISYLNAVLAEADIGQAVQALTVLVRTSGDAVAVQPLIEAPVPSKAMTGQWRAAQSISQLFTHNSAAFLPAAVAVATTIRTPARMLSWMESALAEADASTLEVTADRLPFFKLPFLNLNFDALSVSVTKMLVERLRHQPLTQGRTIQDPQPDVRLARALDNLGASLSRVGRHEDALSAAEETVEHYRRLAQATPAYLPDLARTLANLGASLSSVGRHEDALSATEEAIKHGRQLAQATHAAYSMELAMGLTNRAIQLETIGRRDDAEAAWAEVDVLLSGR